MLVCISETNKYVEAKVANTNLSGVLQTLFYEKLITYPGFQDCAVLEILSYFHYKCVQSMWI